MTFAGQGNRIFLPFFEGLLAEIEAEADGAEGALTRISEALMLSTETGEHWTDAFLYRIRGEILLKRDPRNRAPAEEAFLTAITIAREQQARSFELRAAMSLARLWRDQRKAAAGSRTARSSLWLVHRRVRHARSERGEGTT